jgi:hypothetical protein
MQRELRAENVTCAEESVHRVSAGFLWLEAALSLSVRSSFIRCFRSGLGFLVSRGFVVGHVGRHLGTQDGTAKTTATSYLQHRRAAATLHPDSGCVDCANTLKLLFFPGSARAFARQQPGRRATKPAVTD